MAFIPQPTDAQVECRIRRDFPSERVEAVLRMIQQHGSMPHHLPHPQFIQMAILRLVNGHEELIPQWLALADADSRDVLSAVVQLHGSSWDSDFVPR